MRYESTKEHINLTTVHFSSHRRRSYFRIKKDKASGKTRAWMRRRKEKGYFTNMVRELRTEDTGVYKTMFRMAYEDFNVILRVRRRFQEGNIIAVPASRLSKCQQVPTLLWFHANGSNMLGPTMLRVVGQQCKQCCVRLWAFTEVDVPPRTRSEHPPGGEMGGGGFFLVKGL